MELRVIVLQREETYPGQHAIEVVEVQDEYSDDDNPDWLTDKLEEYLEEPDVVMAKIVAIEIDYDELRAKLFSSVEPIEGTIL